MTGQEDANKASSTHPSDSIGTQKMDSSEVKGNVQTPKSTLEKPKKPTGGDESSGHPSNATFSEKYSEVTEIGNRIVSALASIGIKSAAAPAVAPMGNTMPAAVPAATPAASAAPAASASPTAASATPAQSKSAQEKLAAATKYRDDAEAGYMAAELVASQMGFSKEATEQEKAADAQVEQVIGNIVKNAQADAETYAQFLGAHIAGQQAALQERGLAKKAEGPGMMPAADDGSSAGGAMIPPEVLAAGAGGAGGEGAPPEAGGPGGPGGPGGGGDEEATLDALAEALAQAGVTPEELAAAVEEAQASGGEGGPPGGGGAPPPPAAAAEAQGEGESPQEEAAEKGASAKHIRKAANAVKAAVYAGQKANLANTLRRLAAK
jgi:hypothetical protein